MNDELEFKIGEDESSATVAVSEDGTAEVVARPEAGQAAPQSSELDQYSEGVKKRIDKLTARLRETQRREQAALEYAKNVQARATQLEQQYMTVDNERLGEASSRVQTQVVALKQIIRKAREEGDIDTETEAQQRLAAMTMEQSQIAAAAQQREHARARGGVLLLGGGGGGRGWRRLAHLVRHR
jgi:chromosome segregation ATPase